ncbi:putative ubiquitin thioesterase otu1 [Cyphellophora attinorum]|uniref:Ubiquitin thioesterase OTU n=1 Tax=Cyphellophora attinorum TaxID=1664694 RepID=A0A0N1HEZ2_9EURO|nr:putative ubiquitin thioesterase otu1 [Phialophora attinorum]KPI43724.1 putative ubiquitin thioesterase otu1 [Phialophora attinorum]
MRFRARHPDGRQVVISIEDSATVGQLRAAIREKLSIPKFDLKYGFPPKSLKLDDFPDDTSLLAAEISLNNESVQVIPPSEPESTIKAASAAMVKPPAVPKKAKPNPTDALQETPEIRFPSESATVVLRVMPDDNSCMFRAISTAVSGDQDVDHVTNLRWQCANYITERPDIYNKAILGKEPAKYSAWIQQESSWGGEIELDILSRILGIEIDACIIDPYQVQRYNEGAADRIILIYSGIHYDTLAVSPAPDGDIGAELDMRRFSTVGHDFDYVLEGAKKMCAKLQEQGYMTNTSSFDIRCNTCGWTGKGERSASKHAMETGHVDMEEVR